MGVVGAVGASDSGRNAAAATDPTAADGRQHLVAEEEKTALAVLPPPGQYGP